MCLLIVLLVFKADDELDDTGPNEPLLRHGRESMEISEAERIAVLGQDITYDAGLKGTLMDGIANVS